MQNEFARALALFRKGKYVQVVRVCRRILRREPGHAAAAQLLGLAAGQSGDERGAERYLRKSIALDPHRAEYHANLGNLLRRLGRPAEAARGYRDALALDAGSKPARVGLIRALCELGQAAAAEREASLLTEAAPLDPEAWMLLAMTLREQGKLAEAEQTFRKAAAVAPANPAVHHNLGSVLSRMDRAEEALLSLQRAHELGVEGYELEFNLGRTYLQLYRTDEAEQAFARAVAFRPKDTDAQVNLARLRYMLGDPDFARDILALAQRGDPDMQMLSGIVLRRAGQLERAETIFRDILQREGALPKVRSALAELLHEQGRAAEAEAEILEAAAARPEDPIIAENVIAILLARGKAAEALPYIREQRQASPTGQGWLAYEASALRLLDDPRYQELYDYDRLVRVYELEAPAGWTSMAELNEALLEALNRRHGFVTHPLDQSLRHGSQTARSLLTDPHPAIRAVMQAFAAPLEDYCRSLGTDPRHPTSSRNRGSARITGAWSVQLRKDGFHVNHFHPEGWISSAYYVSPPAEVNDETGKPGWIKFGEPRFPVPGAAPERFVQPKAGRLVLFPSCMWHGTIPITGSETRTTIAFDAVPAERR